MTFGAAFWARPQAPRHHGCQIRWGQIQCADLFVWADGTRSQLPTFSPWRNRLCAKRHLRSPKSLVFQWAVALHLETDTDEGLMKGASNWLQMKKNISRFMLGIKMVASILQRPYPHSKHEEVVLLSSNPPDKYAVLKKVCLLILPRGRNYLFSSLLPFFTLVMDSHWKSSPFPVRLMLRSRSAPLLKVFFFVFCFRATFYHLFPNY